MPATGCSVLGTNGRWPGTKDRILAHSQYNTLHYLTITITITLLLLLLLYCYCYCYRHCYCYCIVTVIVIVIVIVIATPPLQAPPSIECFFPEFHQFLEFSLLLPFFVFSVSSEISTSHYLFVALPRLETFLPGMKTC